MFIILLLSSFLIATVTSFIVIKFFSKTIKSILNRILNDEVSKGWAKYVGFAGFVVGISSGVRIYQLERYINPQMYGENEKVLELTTNRVILGAYRTVIETLQGISWVLLIFFALSLISFVIVRFAEIRSKRD